MPEPAAKGPTYTQSIAASMTNIMLTPEYSTNAKTNLHLLITHESKKVLLSIVKQKIDYKTPPKNKNKKTQRMIYTTKQLLFFPSFGSKSPKQSLI
jgi:hypothetical protein